MKKVKKRKKLTKIAPGMFCACVIFVCMCDFCVHACAMCMGYEFMRFMSDV